MDGVLYIKLHALTIMALSPLAPVFCSMARSAMAWRASGENCSCTYKGVRRKRGGGEVRKREEERMGVGGEEEGEGRGEEEGGGE